MAEGIRKRGNKWSFYVNYQKPDGSNAKKERGGFRTQKEAKEARVAELELINNGVFLVNENITLKEYSDIWLEKYIKPPKRKINTYNRYETILNKHLLPHIGNIQLKKLSALSIEDALDKISIESEIGNTTLQNIYGLLNSILKRAVLTKILRDNPCTAVERPKRDKFKANPLTLEEIKLVLASLDTGIERDTVMRNAIMLSLEVGWRRGEITGFDVSGIDFKNKCIMITQALIYSHGHLYISSTKNSEDRTIYCSDQLMTIFRKIKKENLKNQLEYGEHYIKNELDGIPFNPLLRWRNGKYVHPNYLTTRFKRILENLGIEKRVRWHDLRHTNATLQIQQNINFKVIQERLGHKDITTTLNLYAHVNKELQEQSANSLQDLLNFHGGK